MCGVFNDIFCAFNDFNTAIIESFQTLVCVTNFYSPKLLCGSKLARYGTIPIRTLVLVSFGAFGTITSMNSPSMLNFAFSMCIRLSVLFACVYTIESTRINMNLASTQERKNAYRYFWHEETHRHHQASSLGGVVGMDMCDNANDYLVSNS